MVKGWFVGSFAPTLFNTDSVEVAVKSYKAGEHDVRHYHKIATEITVITQGEAIMNGAKLRCGDIIVIEPFISSDFSAITDVTITVVKLPGARDDKYLGAPNL